MTQLFTIFIIFTLAFSQNRGLWVTRYTVKSKSEIESLKKFIIENKITDLFLQLRGRGDAYYNSRVELNTVIKRNNNSEIKDLIKFLKGHGVRTHIWLNVFLIASSYENALRKKNHVLQKKKNWVDFSNRFKQLSTTIENVKDLKANPKLEGLYVLPCFPDLLEYYQKIIQELVTLFNPDGIHLDYFRLAGKKYGFHPKMRTLFNKKTGLSAEYLMRDDTNIDLSKYNQVEASWVNFLNEKYTDFLLSLTSTNKNVVWSVAVKPDPDTARQEYAQNWLSWLKRDILDFVVPMNYIRSNTIFHNRVKKYIDSKKAERIWVGVSTYNQSLSELKSKIYSLMDANLHITIFSYNDLQKKEIKVLFRN